MNLLPISAFADNYIWMLHDAEHAVVVDPGQAEPVLNKLAQLGLKLQGILVTHHHADHVGGLDALRSATGAPVWGPAYESLPEPVTRVQGGDRVELLGGPWQVIDVPGHTSGHIAFFSDQVQLGSQAAQAQPILFCGDTLFSGGCGRLFEGTPAQMQASLDALAALPASTQVCCAHEYTLSNLRFAQAVEPNNPDLAQYLDHCQKLRAQNLPTLPSSLQIELAINPFMRSRAADVIAAAIEHDPQTKPEEPASVLATLRQWKNVF
ncbi:hydroxyacylglutathione hydrolase [Comamonas sp. Y33R10-2]|uniref:hydroxyacylglutathione hydrolase n=1 Tax=Comamonas sp. Y33R10-2 TaxID=2853257 RepID=UPI001C5C8314|nr:hydroxyacylglutathione hydrolase [Comamonas sp. Y33R10-2]QXZ10462.1 hydroxyacylglutathione hydrolase [Comamonas sp. Y33R10-2]